MPSKLQKYIVTAPDKGIDRSVPINIIEKRGVYEANGMRLSPGAIELMDYWKYWGPGFYSSGAPTVYKQMKFLDTLADNPNDNYVGISSDDKIYTYNSGTWTERTGSVTPDASSRNWIDSDHWRGNTYICCDSKLVKMTGHASNASIVTNYPNNRCPHFVRITNNMIMCVTSQATVPTGFANMLIWSDIDDETIWTENHAGEKEMDDSIIAIENLLNYTIIYCKQSIYRLTFVGVPLVWRIDKITDKIGAWSYGDRGNESQLSRPVVNLGNRHIFVADNITRDVFEFDGFNLRSIGQPIISPLLSTLETTPYLASKQKRSKNEAWFIGKDEFLERPACYIYNYLTKGWTRHLYAYDPAHEILSLCSDRFDDIIVGTSPTNQSNVYVLDDDTSTAESVSGTIITGLTDLGAGDIYKRLQRVQIVNNSHHTTFDLNVYVGYCNDPTESPTFSSAYTLDLASGTSNFIDVEHEAKYFCLKIETGTNSAKAKFKISEYGFYFIPRSNVEG